jgi:hypothetical protein
MTHRIAPVLLLSALTGFAVLPAPHRSSAHPDALIVHEWGTFTTVAGADGRAIEWVPLGGPTDLPCFVERYQNQAAVKVGLSAKVRMETPVLYFYAPHDTTVSVRVTFPRGLMTEWYPHATVTQGPATPATLHDAKQASVIAWPSVAIKTRDAGKFSSEEGTSHYYAARRTESAPLVVQRQSERFLFYRGVANFDVPLSTELAGERSVRVRVLGGEEIPAVVLFEKRGTSLRYLIHERVRGEIALTLPAVDGIMNDLGAALVRLLESQGLYPKEATAMVDTWRDSWFEDGMRVFYLMPRRAVDAVLPLAITPAPSATARVFVGRTEVLTPRDEQAVARAIASNDAAALERYGRLLQPLGARVLATMTDAGARMRARSLIDATFQRYLSRAAVCE